MSRPVQWLQSSSTTLFLLLLYCCFATTLAHTNQVESTSHLSFELTPPSAAGGYGNARWDGDGSSQSSSSLPNIDSKVLNAATFVPPVPVFPQRFRAKCRFLVGPSPNSAVQSNDGRDAGAPLSVFERAAHSMALKPTLSLVHFDGVAEKVREDFYVLSKGVHRRFFSSIKHFNTEDEWLIYHKQPKSPRACFQIPFSYSISALFAAPGSPRVTRLFFAQLARLGDQLEYQGLATIQLMGEDSTSSTRNVTVLHYRSKNEKVDRRALGKHDKNRRGGYHPHKSSIGPGGSSISDVPLFASAAPPVHLYVHPATHQPLVLSTPHARIDILSFQAITDEEQAQRTQGVFDASRASKAKCVPFTQENMNMRNSASSAPDSSMKLKDEL